MTTRFLSTLAALAASVTLGANLISSGSAQAAIFDFNAVWADNTTTKGWIELDDTKVNQYSNYYFHQRAWWNLDSILDADFTHEGTRYNSSDITNLSFTGYIFSESGYHQPLYGSATNYLSLGFNNQSVSFFDYGADGSTHSESDYGSKYTNDEWWSEKTTNSVSVVERSAEAVPEPTTMAGLALVGLGIAGTRRKQTKASVKV